jgi:thymidylate kinase
MIIIVEGIDRCGKTTFIDKMCETMPKMLRFKDLNVCSKIYTDEDFSSFSLGKLDTSVAFLKQLSEKGYDIIVDRLHLTELVYGECERNTTSYKEIGQLDNELAKLDTLLVLVEPTDLNWSNQQAEKDQSKHYHAFKKHYANSAIEKYHTNFHRLDETVHTIIHRMAKINKYKANIAIEKVSHSPNRVNNTLEFVNFTSIFDEITTAEIIKTFDLDASLVLNFEYDVRNKTNGVYGPYKMEKYHDIFDKLHDAMKHLIDDNIQTRRCIIQFDKEHCFQNIQFLVRDNKLKVICNMRSCNAIDNYKPDIYICSILADEFKNEYIRLFHKSLNNSHEICMNIGSFHMFVKEEDNASE